MFCFSLCKYINIYVACWKQPRLERGYFMTTFEKHSKANKMKSMVNTNRNLHLTLRYRRKHLWRRTKIWLFCLAFYTASCGKSKLVQTRKWCAPERLWTLNLNRIFLKRTETWLVLKTRRTSFLMLRTVHVVISHVPSRDIDSMKHKELFV